MQLNILSLVISPQGKGGGGVCGGGEKKKNNPGFKVNLTLKLTLEGNILTVGKYPWEGKRGDKCNS